MHVLWDGENTVKLVILGDSGVGKSSVAHRFVSNEFQPYMDMTIGASYFSKRIIIETDDILSHSITLKIWDTAGQERFNSLVPMYYRGAGAAILMFDITRPDSFISVKRWVTELKRNGPDEMILALCGNKADLKEHRRVSYAKAKKYADDIGAFYIETSARSDINVHKMFREIGIRVPVLQSAPICSGIVESFESSCEQNSKCCYF